MSRHHVLILGGGFAGLYTAIELEKALKEDTESEITLANRDNFFHFYADAARGGGQRFGLNQHCQPNFLGCCVK